MAANDIVTSADILAQVEAIPGAIELVCIAILKARVTGSMANIETAESMARLRMAKKMASEACSMLRYQCKIAAEEE